MNQPGQLVVVIYQVMIYGGSVNEKTILSLKEITEIDGYLIGVISLEIDKLKRIIEVVR